MRVELELDVADIPAEAVPWQELALEVEDTVARVLGIDGDQVALHVLDVVSTDS